VRMSSGYSDALISTVAIRRLVIVLNGGLLCAAVSDGLYSVYTYSTDWSRREREPGLGLGGNVKAGCNKIPPSRSQLCLSSILNKRSSH